MSRAVGVISNLHPLEYEHSLDSAAIESLKTIPGLDKLIKLFISQGVAKYLHIQCTGSNLRVSAKIFPDLHARLTDACKTLGIAKVPDLYLEQDDRINAFVVGDEQTIMCVTTGAIEKLSDSELLFLFGHELGHVKSHHMLYHMLAKSLSWLGTSWIGNAVGVMTLGLGNVFNMALESALMKWSRTSELSSDRCGLLACQDLDACMGVFIKWAGLPHTTAVSATLEEFVNQAREFDQTDYGLIAKFMKWEQSGLMSHPFNVVRAAELLKWVESGEYEAVISRTSSRRVRVKSLDGIEYCRKCNYRMSQVESFCPSCGEKLN